MSDRKWERRVFDLPSRWRKIFGAGTQRSVQKQAAKEAALKKALEEDFLPVLRFAVVTDIHVCGKDHPRNALRLRDSLRLAYRLSAEDPDYKALDAIVFTGDNTNTGSEEEYDELTEVLDAEIEPGTRFIPVMGNHEFHKTGREGFARRLRRPLEPHETVKGFHFIGLSPKPEDTWHTPAQALWMLRELKKAKRDDPEKPIFTMQHGHIFKTVYVSRSWYTQLSFLLHPVYALFPQVVNFSGHSHAPVNHPVTVWQKRYTAVNAGTLNSLEMERDVCKKAKPEDAETVAQFLLVEVDEDNRVRIRPVNTLTGAYFKKTDNTVEDPGELQFLIENPADRKSFVYTPKRVKTDAPPRFDGDAKLAVDALGDGKVRLTFPEAKSKTCVYAYRAVFTPEGGRKKDAVIKEEYGKYYIEPTPKTVVLDAEGLRPGVSYTVRVYPLNVWRDAGEAIETEFHLS